MTMLLILESSSASRVVAPSAPATNWSATTKPTRAPGKTVLEYEPRWMTDRVRSSAFRVGSEVPGLTIYGTTPHKASIVSFTLEGAHPHDIGTILDEAGIAVRAGHHCAQPTMDRFGVAGTVRASFGLYNRFDEVDSLIAGLQRVREIFG